MQKRNLPSEIDYFVTVSETNSYSTTMTFPFEITNEYTGKLLLRYHSIAVEGLFYLEISHELIEQVRLLNLLSVIGSGHCEGFNCTQAYLLSKTKFFLLAPNTKITELTSDEDFGVTYNNGKKNYWHVKSLNDKKFKIENILQCELLFIAVGASDFWLTILPYENAYLCARIYTNKVGLTLIGI